MKIRHIWTVLCRESVINQEDNVMSLIGVLETVNSTITLINPQLPKPEKFNIPFNFEIVSYWLKDSLQEIKMQVKTTMIDPDAKEISSNINDSLFPKGIKKLRTRLKVQGLSVTKSGDYTILVEIKTTQDKDFKKVAELPLTITMQFAEKPLSKQANIP